MSFYRRYGKRVFDVAGAVALLPVLGLVTVVVGPAIKMSDAGPVFYKSQRRGRDGKHYNMIKFRSMAVNAPDLRNEDLSTMNSDDDPRVTRLGRVLRRTSIDELPQIWNVLIGDMSFVGPRPNMTRQRWEDLTESERKRIRVRPGITGLSQALYRNSASTAQKYRVDGLYVDRLSLSLDLKILVRTITSVARAKNINSVPTDKEMLR